MNEITNRRETSKLRFHGYSYSASSNNKLLLLSNRYVAPSRFLDSKLAISECLAIINPSLSLSLCSNRWRNLVTAAATWLTTLHRGYYCLIALLFVAPFQFGISREVKKRRGFGNRDRVEGLEAAVPRSLDWLTLPIVPKILQRPSFGSDKSNNLSEKVRGRTYRSLGMKLKERGRELVQRAHTNGGKIGFAMTAEAM